MEIPKKIEYKIDMKNRIIIVILFASKASDGQQATSAPHPHNKPSQIMTRPIQLQPQPLGVCPMPPSLGADASFVSH
jgi:hypothetical protein